MLSVRGECSLLVEALGDRRRPVWPRALRAWARISPLLPGAVAQVYRVDPCWPNAGSATAGSPLSLYKRHATDDALSKPRDWDTVVGS
jgi:hypothetical protein